MSIVGEVRPSQLMFTFGIGATLDLPEFSALVLGLDFWKKDLCTPVAEPRLLAAVQRLEGDQVRELRLPPVQENDTEPAEAGVPVVPFPRWMRCTACGLMASLESNLFEKRERMRMPTQFVHTNCNVAKNPKYPPRAVPVRFLLACANGHLSDVPWNAFVHDGTPCADPELRMNAYGITGDLSDIVVSCKCGKQKSLTQLETALRSKQAPYTCCGLHPHLRRQEQNPCEERPHLVNLGASNLWFSQTVSVLSIPARQSRLAGIVRENWDKLSDVTDAAIVQYLAHPKRIAALMDFSPEEVLQAIEAERQGCQDADMPDDIKLPEWEIFSGRQQVQASPVLEVHAVAAPRGFEDAFEGGMLAPRLSEVRAMYGFTRLNTQQELDLGIISRQSVVPLTWSSPTWLPAYESRGEGFFLRLREDRLQAWEQLPAVRAHDAAFYRAHQAWRKSRRFPDPEGGYPGLRFVLLHTLAHALMQQIVLDCGYTAASIRERLYCRTPGMPGGPMAGFLLYTAATDSEGTLGGLVSLGGPETLGRYIAQALENMRLCASDPLCAERLPDADGRGIHGAACHACLFSPETSCECGNRYLDRNVLVNTFAARQEGLAFWGSHDA
ncbi:DUF1998 domain-containing protein [uncultured Desulfovibrio sp.]|uniref:DUF1998 domain-containing protein n=1 Tax=uncultured Desulfovibrio sp. TaxID=167968 RepID=UPI002617793E|nr:DUF1998 domain-containing protein [uncultured Desulfovibrio sp.]